MSEPKTSPPTIKELSDALLALPAKQAIGDPRYDAWWAKYGFRLLERLR